VEVGIAEEPGYFGSSSLRLFKRRGFKVREGWPLWKVLSKAQGA